MMKTEFWLWFGMVTFSGRLWSATIFVDGSFTGTVQNGSPQNPYSTITKGIAAASPGDLLSISTGQYHEAPVTISKAVTLTASGGPVAIDNHLWGRLANRDFVGQPIKAALFFAGQPLDGSANNPCGPVPNLTNEYTLYPVDQRHLQWLDPNNPTDSANRDFAVQSTVDAGINVLSMSSWGESWLPCTTPCPQVPACGCELTNCTWVPRCFHIGTNQYCKIGWYGAANMQITPEAKDQLFDAAVGKPILIMPFIESRFLYDWNFHDEFPTDSNGNLAPGLISQIEDLINVYLLHPSNPAWPAKWAQVFDRQGQARYAVTVIQAASATLPPSDPASDEAFAAGFDAVAQKVLSDTGILVGFFIDPIARDPTSTFGCPGIDLTQTGSTYGSSFKPDPSSTGPFLRNTKSLLGIQCYSPEGWIDGTNPGYSVTECYKLQWKIDFSRRWFETGIPFLQDVTPGYNGTNLFSGQPGLHLWGYDDSWRQGLTQLVQQYGSAGMVYNSWNGYGEGLAGMETVELPASSTIGWLQSLTGLYP